MWYSLGNNPKFLKKKKDLIKWDRVYYIWTKIEWFDLRQSIILSLLDNNKAKLLTTYRHVKKSKTPFEEIVDLSLLRKEK